MIEETNEQLITAAHAYPQNQTYALPLLPNLYILLLILSLRISDFIF